MNRTEIMQKADDVIKDQKLREMFKKCFMSTLETSLKVEGDKTYIITGDINAMWLRDSSCQVNHYLKLMKDDQDLQNKIKGLIRSQIEYVLLDPYANAFLNTEDVPREYHDTTIMKPYVWERKFELDSLCYPVKLAYQYYKETNDTTIFDKQYLYFIHTILDVFETEQYHSQKSSYTFERDMAKVWNLRKTETLQNHGHGFDTRYTGMVWSAFRPSDDACALNYNIPGNMFCSVILSYLVEILRDLYHDERLVERIIDLKFQIDYGIELFGTYLHPKYGKIYAYETDGYGNHILMDDANVPSLLSLPYLEYCHEDDPIYQNTRRFISVSYTHLDVYKRQMRDWLIEHGVAASDIEAETGSFNTRQNLGDVYKRQVRDTMYGDLISGMTRALEAMLLATAVAIGVYTGLKMAAMMGGIAL